MDKMKVGTGDWVVVCDGRKALILGAAGFGLAGAGQALAQAAAPAPAADAARRPAALPRQVPAVR